MQLEIYYTVGNILYSWIYVIQLDLYYTVGFILYSWIYVNYKAWAGKLNIWPNTCVLKTFRRHSCIKIVTQKLHEVGNKISRYIGISCAGVYQGVHSCITLLEWVWHSRCLAALSPKILTFLFFPDLFPHIFQIHEIPWRTRHPVHFRVMQIQERMLTLMNFGLDGNPIKHIPFTQTKLNH